MVWSFTFALGCKRRGLRRFFWYPDMRRNRKLLAEQSSPLSVRARWREEARGRGRWLVGWCCGCGLEYRRLAGSGEQHEGELFVTHVCFALRRREWRKHRNLCVLERECFEYALVTTEFQKNRQPLLLHCPLEREHLEFKLHTKNPIVYQTRNTLLPH